VRCCPGTVAAAALRRQPCARRPDAPHLHFTCTSPALHLEPAQAAGARPRL